MCKYSFCKDASWPILDSLSNYFPSESLDSNIAHEQIDILVVILLCSGRYSVTYGKRMPTWWWLLCSIWGTVHFHQPAWRQQWWETRYISVGFIISGIWFDKWTWQQRELGRHFFLVTKMFGNSLSPPFLIWFFYGSFFLFQFDFSCLVFKLYTVQLCHKSSYAYYVTKQEFPLPHKFNEDLTNITFFFLINGKIVCWNSRSRYKWQQHIFFFQSRQGGKFSWIHELIILAYFFVTIRGFEYSCYCFPQRKNWSSESDF